jgi:hypothetical protein
MVRVSATGIFEQVVLVVSQEEYRVADLLLHIEQKADHLVGPGGPRLRWSPGKTSKSRCGSRGNRPSKASSFSKQP